ncbi:MAG: 16S rRNA (cytidine(1402)-2'-O)-methyltransferase [Alphaproteobacteria bacterium]|nr:16S rRNA (cytidine(1402)-2'-O)-methyltransferase [Alphaproteobacteria bacterium]
MTDEFAEKPKGAASGSKSGRLAVVATPIGNLGDITLRALEALKNADAIACEDTRTTAKLLARHGIRRPTTPYHDHNAQKARPALLARMAKGETIALVSDAGTPLVADPGYKLVTEAIAAGIGVDFLPGPSAPIAALVLSGLPTDRFLFAGFLAPKTAARRETLKEFVSLRASLIFFESPQRLAASLADMASVLGDRPAAIARELTKLYEEVRRGTLAELAAHYEQAGAPKGEIVVVVGPPLAQDAPSEADLDALLRTALKRESLRDAVAAVAEATGEPRRAVYARALTLDSPKRKK